MNSLYSCVAHDHDVRVVALAAVICVMGVYATFSLATFAAFTRNVREQRVWTTASAITCATSTWATHFIAMLAFHPGAPSGFDPLLTVTSFAVALVLIGAGLTQTVFARDTAWRALGGAVIGAGISAMHYVGMAAFQVPGVVTWNMGAIGASVAASVAFGMLGGANALSAVRWRRWIAPPAVIISICSLHFIGMTAMTIAYDPTRMLAAGVVDRTELVVWVAGAALLIMAAAMTGVVLHGVAQRRRRAERRRLGDLADVALEGLLICDGDHIVSANRSASELCGVDASALVGLELPALLSGARWEAISDTAEEEAVLAGASGPIPVRVLRRELGVAGARPTLIALRDKRARRPGEDPPRDLAYNDALTGLANRARFTEALDVQSAALRRAGDAFSVVMIDLDRFKTVNDTLGHHAGDLLLQRVAGRLRAAVRGDDMLARLGGDEFAVLHRQSGDPTQAGAVAARIVDLIGRPFLIDGQIVNIGASVGIALAPLDGGSAEELLRNADLAAYSAKAGGRGTFRYFAAELDANARRRRGLETDLRRAVARQEFELFYQPLIDVGSGAMQGAEALIRWNDPSRGLISPADFIPLAEETGLIANMGAWVLRTACAEAVTWPAHMSVAVNLSPVQFRDPKLADTVRGVLAATGLAPERLELEITEGVLIADEARTLTTLNQLRACGVRISMDDFGTGYSSLSYLRRFPFDKIKVDQSFICGVPHDAESVAIVRAILTMSACLGLTTAVEGVETPEQLAFTSSTGCDQLQGFLFSRPLSAEDFHRFIQNVRRAA